jgi:predicted HTH transcriptional regulator
LIVWRQFTSVSDLKSAIYASLIRYLEEKEYIRTGPFDASVNSLASLTDLDNNKITEFVHVARAKRGFPLSADANPEIILSHLNLLANNRVNNAAVLLFGKKPQRFIICSEIRCAHFHGTEIIKPIPSYQVYKGDVFELVNQAVDFVLSKIDVSVGTRAMSAQVPVHYELPAAAALKPSLML